MTAFSYNVRGYRFKRLSLTLNTILWRRNPSNTDHLLLVKLDCQASRILLLNHLHLRSNNKLNDLFAQKNI